ncbi:hypothetical protein BP5796_03507 [Coleophoma crateriformis]|uniref:Zn(2)-C6 fungal-type domain-containing protein n=1 Tax=Coleophoma crateriformis TaxID=565419 RepID=A0A3D8SNA5_9HELO|nr:hypothetical protein BP5796_03507 [Coleophoma crateriformis]
MAASPKISSPAEEPSRPAPLACTTCRRKHLKCDAKQPICSRCAGGALQCSYTPSRRGHRGSTRSQEPELGRGQFSILTPSTAPDLIAQRRVSTTVETTTGFPSPMPTEAFVYSRTNSDDRRNNTMDYYRMSYGTPPQQPVSPPYRPASGSGTPIEEKQLANLFYTYFHPAHPILLPKSLYFTREYPPYLRLVVQFIGSHYSSAVPSDQLRSATAKELADDSPKSPFMVQARLLYAIALHGRNEIKEAQAMLAQAVSLALELGMNRRDFASTHGRQQVIEEESLRRTWWELYVIDGIMAAFWRKSEFNIHSVTSDVLLPCEEATYTDGLCVAGAPSVSQFDGRLFADDEIQFSSFCYRIEAVRILARVLALTGAREVHQDQVQAVDNALAGWAHHLPPTKADIINTFGEVDEILFQAHMIIQYASIFLHFPRSNLLSTLAATADIAGGQRDIHVSPTSTQHTHAIKATEASKQLSNLAALRLPVQNHTPFFICGLVLSAVVQLSACSVHAGNCLEQHRDRVTLIIGVLKSLSRTWQFSQVVLQQIKKVAAEVFNVGCSKSKEPQQAATHDSGIDTSVGDDTSWLDNLDIQALQNLMPFDTEMVYAEPS